MKNIFYIFLSRPITTTMFFIVVVILGIVSFFNLPIELNPNIELPRLSVSIAWNGVSAEAVEAFVTAPIEAKLAEIKGVKNITSVSSQGYSSIMLEFHEKSDLDFIRIEINERLSVIKDELPFGVSPPKLSEYVPEDFRDLQGFITYTISGNQSANEVRKYVNDNMIYPLMSISGIANVQVSGGNDREITIELDHDKTEAFNISNTEISNAISKIEEVITVGMIKEGNAQVIVKIKNVIDNLSVIENQIIKKTDSGTLIKLKDIGRVFDDFSVATSYYRINGKETVSLILDKEPGTNSLKLSEEVYKKMDELSKDFPKDFSIIKEIDKSEKVREELGELTGNGIISFLIIMVVLLAIFRSINYSIIIIISIVFSILFSLLSFYLFSISLNIITISAFILGFGFMVDNSIVVIDYLDKHKNEKNIKHLSIILKEIYNPVLASTLTTIGVFLPLVFLTGELQLYFEQFAIGVVFNLFASLVVSFTIIPMLFTRYGNNKFGEIDTTKEKKSLRVYSFLMEKLFKRKKTSFAILILIVGLPVWLLPERIETPVISEIYNPIFESEIYSEIKPYINYSLGGTLNLFFNHVNRGNIWSFGDETYIYVRMELPNGNTIERMNGLTKKIEREILNYKENIKTVVANVRDEESASIRIEFTKEQGQSSFPYMIKNYLTAYATRLGGLNVSVYGFGPGFSSGGESTFSYTVVAKGFNYIKVKELAEKFKAIIEKNPRIDNIDIDRSMNYWEKDTYEINAQIKRSNLAKYNISIIDLLSVISANTNGNLTWDKFNINDEEVNYSLKFTNFRERQLNEVENLVVKNKKGTSFKVNELIDFNEKKVMSSIHRENQQYIRNISFDYKGPFKYGNKFIKSSFEKIIVPEGFTIEQREFSFRFAEEDEIDIWKILILAIILTFMISASLFESLSKPGYIMLSVPFAMIGVIFMSFLFDLALDRGAYAGLLLLVGLSVNNSIMLVDSISKSGKHLTGLQLINLSYTRLRPIFTTTITTAGALIPLLFSAEITFWRSLSYSVLGGIVLSAIFTVFYVPLFYSQFGVKKK